MRKLLRSLLFSLLLCSAGGLLAQITCNPAGNLWAYVNYDGGILNINVDVNIPNIKIGVCTYEPTTINITGAFAGNVTEVRYAGYVSTNNNHCPNSPSTTTITGVPANITSVNFLPPSTLSNPNGYSSIVCGYTCSTTSNQGGCNTADQIKDYFQVSMGATMVSYFTQYGCWAAAPYSLSAGGNCCNSVVQCNLLAGAGSDVTICPGGSTTLQGGSTGGGTTYAWAPTTGLSNPSSATTSASPSQTTSYILTVTDGAVCTDTDTITVTVANPQAAIAAIPGVCAGSPSFALSGGSPSGGVWSGNHVANGMFNPVTAGVGVHSVTYVFVDGNGCPASANGTVEVFATPLVTFPTIGPFCQNDPSMFLVSGSPNGGSYAGPGIANGAFFPSIAGVGNHTLMYAYSDANGCSDTASQTITVHPIPVTPTVSLGGIDSLYASTPGDSFVWYLNGQHWLTNGAVVQAPQNGLYTVVVWANGCPSDTSQVFSLEIQSILIGGRALEAWPNPNSGQLHLRSEGNQFEAGLYDLQGRLVLPLMKINSEGILDLSKLSTGTYLLQIAGAKGALRIIRE